MTTHVESTLDKIQAHMRQITAEATNTPHTEQKTTHHIQQSEYQQVLMVLQALVDKVHQLDLYMRGTRLNKRSNEKSQHEKNVEQVLKMLMEQKLLANDRQILDIIPEQK